MSQENVEIVRRIIDATRRGDWEAALRDYDQGVILDQSRMPGGGVYRGHEGLREFYGRWFGAWEHLRIKPERVIDAGDQVVDNQRNERQGKEQRSGGEDAFRQCVDDRPQQSRPTGRFSSCLRGPRSRRAAGVGQGSSRNLELTSSTWADSIDNVWAPVLARVVTTLTSARSTSVSSVTLPRRRRPPSGTTKPIDHESVPFLMS